MNKTQYPSAAVAEPVSVMIAYWDKDQICRFANPAYLEWFGQKNEDFVDIMTLNKLLGPVYEKNQSHIQAVLRGEPQSFEREIFISTSGRRCSMATYFPDIKNGIVVGFYDYLAETQEMKQLKKELIRSNVAITDQNNQLRNFANIVSHNLRSYAGNLDSLLQLLDLVESESEKAATIGYLHDLSKRFTTTVNHLTQIVRFQNQQDKPHAGCNLKQYICDTIGMLRIQIDNTSAIIRIHADADINIVTNPAYLESILLNLLSNAIKYRHPKRRPEIIIYVYEVEKYLMLEVSDNGVGIDLTKHGKAIFGMNNTFHGNTDANGIGLYITKYQIDSLGGSIAIESEVDIGTTFRVFFKK